MGPAGEPGSNLAQLRKLVLWAQCWYAAQFVLIRQGLSFSAGSYYSSDDTGLLGCFLRINS